MCTYRAKSFVLVEPLFVWRHKEPTVFDPARHDAGFGLQNAPHKILHVKHQVDLCVWRPESPYQTYRCVKSNDVDWQFKISIIWRLAMSVCSLQLAVMSKAVVHGDKRYHAAPHSHLHMLFPPIGIVHNMKVLTVIALNGVDQP